MHILYAEDSSLLAEPIVYLLQADGHRVTHVSDGAAAVAQYLAETPDLVLMDVLMPVMDGIEATRQIKAIPVKKWVPIIILSALDSNEDLIKGLQVGADDYVTKPLDLHVLLARVHAKQRIVDIQNSLIGILDNVYEGIITIDERGIMQGFNLAAERIFGYSAKEAVGNNVNMLMPEPYKTQHDGYLHNYHTTRQPKIIGSARKVLGARKNGEIFPMHLAVTQVAQAKGVNFIGLVRDISQEEEDRQQIEHLALHDVLTGLPNRAQFISHASNCIVDAKPFALIFIDIDGFKPINDNFGHEIGDEVLKTLAQRMRGSIAKRDLVARLGGDEFVVILQGVSNPDDARKVALRVLDKIGEPMSFGGNKCDVGASMGVALYPWHGQHYEEILSAADHAMYQAKHAGKNCVVMTGAVE